MYQVIIWIKRNTAQEKVSQIINYESYTNLHHLLLLSIISKLSRISCCLFEGETYLVFFSLTFANSLIKFKRFGNQHSVFQFFLGIFTRPFFWCFKQLLCVSPEVVAFYRIKITWFWCRVAGFLLTMVAHSGGMLYNLVY